VLATGGYGNVFFLSTNAKGSNVTATWRAYKKGAAFANPCYTQIHPTCIPVTGHHQSKLTLMSESLRNDGRVGSPSGRKTAANLRLQSRRRTATITRAQVSQLWQPRPARHLVPRRQRGLRLRRGVGPGGLGVYLDFSAAIQRLGTDIIRERYGNLFDMYERITGKTRTKPPCAFTRRFTMRWAALG